jgi:hypothetical protein
MEYKNSMDSGYSGMIREDKSAVANLPQSVIQKAYPKCKYIGGDLDDTMKVLDSARSYDVGKIKANKPDSMW